MKSGLGPFSKGLSNVGMASVLGGAGGSIAGHTFGNLVFPNSSNAGSAAMSGAVGAFAGQLVMEGARTLYSQMYGLELPPQQQEEDDGVALAENALAVEPICRVIDRPNENGDGLITLKEFVEAFDTDGDAELAINEVMGMFDINGDGQLSKDESARARQWFERVDTDGSGTIDARELAVHFDINKDGSVSVAELARDLFDLNRDGIVSSTELEQAANWMSSLPILDEWTSGLVGRLEMTVPERLQLDMRFYSQLPTWRDDRGQKCMYAHYSMNYARLVADHNRAFRFFDREPNLLQTSETSTLGRLGLLNAARP